MDLEGVPPGTDLRDASTIMPEDRLLRYRDSGSVALGANLWRIELLAKGYGCWVDMDFIFLRSLDFDSDYLFGWEYENWINNAILMAPPDSAMVRDLQSLPRANRRPPWWGPRRSLHFYWRRLREGRMDLEDYPWGTFSAGLVTHVVKTNRLDHYAQQPEVFYPVRWKDARSVYGPEDEVRSMLHSETRAIHLWHSRLHGLRDEPPPAGSFIAAMCDRHDIDPRN